MMMMMMTTTTTTMMMMMMMMMTMINLQVTITVNCCFFRSTPGRTLKLALYTDETGGCNPLQVFMQFRFLTDILGDICSRQTSLRGPTGVDDYTLEFTAVSFLAT